MTNSSVSALHGNHDTQGREQLVAAWRQQKMNLGDGVCVKPARTLDPSPDRGSREQYYVLLRM